MFRITLERAIFLVVVGVLSLIIFSFTPNAEAESGINRQIPFQGTLKSAPSGRPVTGTRDMVFRIYDVASGGIELWEGEHTVLNGNAVSVDDGIFNVMLGAGTGNEFSLDFSQDTYYLGVTVGADSEMTPRERLGASSYAFNADLLDGIDSIQFLRVNVPLQVTESTTTPLLSLTQTGLGNFMSLYDASSVKPVFSVQSTGEVISTKFQSTLDEVNIFSGALKILSNEKSVFNGDVTLADGVGVSFGSTDGITFRQDLFGIGFNNIMIAPTPNGIAAEDGSVNLLAPKTFGFFANAAEDGSGFREPALTLDENGSAQIYSLSQGNLEDRVFYIDFGSGVQITSGNLDIASGDLIVAIGNLSVSEGSLRIENGSLQVDSLAQELVPAYLMSDTGGNVIASSVTPPDASDERLKKNIQTFDNALNTLLNLRGVRYEWRDAEHFGTQTEIGFIAQELEEVLPEVVRKTGEYLGVNTRNITAVIVEAVKEMYGEMQEYFSRTEQLEREVELLRAEVEALRGSDGEPSSTSVPATEEPVVPEAVNEVAEPEVSEPAPEEIEYGT